MGSPHTPGPPPCGLTRPRPRPSFASNRTSSLQAAYRRRQGRCKRGPRGRPAAPPAAELGKVALKRRRNPASPALCKAPWLACGCTVHRELRCGSGRTGVQGCGAGGQRLAASSRRSPAGCRALAWHDSWASKLNGSAINPIPYTFCSIRCNPPDRNGPAIERGSLLMPQCGEHRAASRRQCRK